MEGKLLGVMVNYACHATASPGGISANWIYYLEKTIQGALDTRAPVVFMQGACGDVTQVDNLSPNRRPEPVAWSQFVGGRIGAEAVRVYVTERSFYASKDGTRIPLYVSRRKDVPLAKETPCLLYGYGGFNVAVKPAFSPGVLAWLELGGTYAVANLRGGSEYGREWHEAGTKERKQTVFDDFIAAAEHLIAKGWTSTPKLAIHGRSNGGLLVGACLTQRPDLYGAAIPGVGVLDMLRYHRFTIGWAWSSDYGRSDDAEAFRYLSRYSPLHNLRAGTCYPATLITTGQHDDRVVPAHSFKFAAALQAAQGCANPCLIRIEMKGGHGAGKPMGLQIEELADQWAFLVRALRFTPRVGVKG